jgi:hypothetical protein
MIRAIVRGVVTAKGWHAPGRAGFETINFAHDTLNRWESKTAPAPVGRFIPLPVRRGRGPGGIVAPGTTRRRAVFPQQEGVLLPDVDRAPLQGPLAFSPGFALTEGSLLSPIPGLLPFPRPVVVLGVVPTPPVGLPIELAPAVPPLTPPTPPPAPPAP